MVLIMGARFILFELLLALCCYRHVQPSAFTMQFSQSVVELLPCDDLNSTVSLYNSTLVTIKANISRCPKFKEKDTAGFRISTNIATESTGSVPVVFTARQLDNDGFVSWNAPLKSNSTLLLPNVSHTMCTVENFTADNMPLFYIDAFTSSKDSINFTIKVEPVQNFVLQTNKTYPIVVGPASSQVYYYKIPSDVQLVTVEASSLDLGCTIISIQNNTCPVNDLLKNARNKGIYQTMMNSAFITISSDSIPNREFLLVLVTADYSLCYTNTSYNPDRIINIKIGHMNPTSDYKLAMALPVLVCIGISLFSFLVCCFYAPRCVPGCNLIRCRCKRTLCFHLPVIDRQCCICDSDKRACCVCVREWNCFWINAPNDDSDNMELCVSDSEPEEQDLVRDNESINYGAISSARQRIPGENSQELSSSAHENDQDPRVGPGGDDENSNGQRNLGSVRVQNQRNEQNQGNQKSYQVYGWNTVTVGIFYALPAVQLVYFQQIIQDRGGDQDICYYNFKCAHPVGSLSAFNNIWSNIGYVFLGGVFILTVMFRHFQYQVRRSKDRNIVNYGVQQCFGIYYAMGFALMLEGCMSALYHICPGNANFQFDTAFMFITGGIILVKVYQNRHPNVQANAFIAFFAFAIIILFTAIGIYNDTRHPISVKVAFFFITLAIVLIFLGQFYKWSLTEEGRMKRERILETYECGFHWQLKSACFTCTKDIYAMFKLLGLLLKSMCCCKEFCKHYKHRIGKHLLILCCNFILVAIVCALKLGIATAILAFFVVNIVLYLFIYCVIKICYGEPWTWLNLLFFVLLAAAWGGARHFYGTVTEWAAVPLDSKHSDYTKASSSPNSTDSLYLQLTEVPISPDLVNSIPQSGKSEGLV